MSSRIDERVRWGDSRLPPNFWKKVQVEPDGCWLWTGARSRTGYSSFGCKDGGVEDRDPADMTDDELNAAIDFHRRQIARYSNEAAKIWRLRIRLNGGEDIDKRMLAEMHERRATASTETSARCVECGHGIETWNPVTALCEFDSDPSDESVLLCGCKCIFPSPPSPAPEQVTEQKGEQDAESLAINAKMVQMEERFKKATSHDAIVTLVWACRALIDADTEAAPFFTLEATDRQVVYTAALRLYFEHAQRILGRAPSPVEVDEIETGFCEPRLEALKAERIEKGRRLLATLAAPATSVAQPAATDEHVEPPERIWTVGGRSGHFFSTRGNFATVEYVLGNFAIGDAVETLESLTSRRRENDNP